MVSPQMLRQYYLPQVRKIIEPLVDAGVRLIHHCDGDVRPFLDDFLALGFSGFQGFQFELGFDLYEVAKKRSARGEPVLFFASMSVTRTLPFGTEQDVRDEVDYLLDATSGGRGMYLFTSNVTGVEVPVANIRAGYAHVKTWDPRQQRHATHCQWPWGVNHAQ
jgi:uroporphyrinogen decarboxylase